MTTGGPITLRLINNDAKLERLAEPAAPARRPHRPGRRDQLPDRHPPGARARSARETALRVAVGALAKLLLRELGITVFGYVRELGGIAAPPLSFDLAVRDASPVYTLNPEADAAIVAAIDAAREAGDTLGGVVETIVTGCPIGLGSHAQWDRKLDARLAAAVMSVQAIKAVEIGLGVEAARRPGSQGDGPDPPTSPTRRPTTAASASAARPTTPAASKAAPPTASRSSSAPPRSRSARWPRAGRRSTWPPRPRSPPPTNDPTSAPFPAASVIVENVVAFEIAAAVVEKYVGTSLDAIRTAMRAIHELNHERLAHWGDSVVDSKV